jgi:hypothetical protein
VYYKFYPHISNQKSPPSGDRFSFFIYKRLVVHHRSKPIAVHQHVTLIPIRADLAGDYCELLLIGSVCINRAAGDVTMRQQS